MNFICIAPFKTKLQSAVHGRLKQHKSKQNTFKEEKTKQKHINQECNLRNKNIMKNIW